MALTVISGLDFDNVVKLTDISTIASIWWDGVEKIPYVIINTSDTFLITYIGTIINTVNNQQNPLTKISHSDNGTYTQGDKLYLSPPHEVDPNIEYSISKDGYCIDICRLVISNISDLTGVIVKCGFYVCTNDDNKKLVFDYTEEIFS